MIVTLQQLIGVYPFRQKRLWIVVNTVGFAVPTLLLLMFHFEIPSLFFEEPLLLLNIPGLFVVTLVGFCQIFVIQQILPRLKIWPWIVANSVGGVLVVKPGCLISKGLTHVLILLGWAENTSSFHSIFNGLYWLLSFILHGLCIGCMVGLAQVVVLRNHIDGLKLWWFTNLLGRALGWGSAYGLYMLLTMQTGVTLVNISRDKSTIVGGMFLGAVGGFIYGMITAYALGNLNVRQQPE